MQLERINAAGCGADCVTGCLQRISRLLMQPSWLHQIEPTTFSNQHFSCVALLQCAVSIWCATQSHWSDLMSVKTSEFSLVLCSTIQGDHITMLQDQDALEKIWSKLQELETFWDETELAMEL